MSNVKNTAIRRAMLKVSQEDVDAIMKKIANATAERKAYELEKRGDGLSKDFQNIVDLHNETFARFAAVIGVNVFPYIAAPLYSKEEFERESNLSRDCYTVNQKGYKKTRGAADFFFHNDTRGLEAVLKSFVACAIVASQYHEVLPRDLCTKFLGKLEIAYVSEELAEHLQKHRAEHMTGGADTQTSQCTLQLATMRAGFPVRNGKRKDFALDAFSPVTIAFAERFGLMEQLKKAQTLQKEARK